MGMGTPMEFVRTLVLADRSAGEILSSASAFMVIKGVEELTLSITTGSLPVIKNGGIDYSAQTGAKMKGRGKNQSLNELSITLHERETLSTKKAVENTQLSNKNGDLEIEFWVGDGELVPSTLWGKMILGLIITEDNPEFDAEGTESPMSRTFSLVGHYFPEDCSISDSTRGVAGKVADIFKTIDGLTEC